MAVSLFPRPVLLILNLAICVLYPAYLTFAHLYSSVLHNQHKAESEDHRHNSGLIAHYIAYWTIYVLFSKLESYALAYIIPIIPFFYEAKLLSFFWLASEQFKGAGYLFHRYGMKNLLHSANLLRSELDNKLDARHRKTLTDIAHQMGSIDDVKLSSME
ncbi:TB2 HVA22 domain-containing protein [Babesia ovis]|uniref:TB2 HVA22 domain-containing protein n=1 Tax=Babesia ovis TaxID=5869 RepID=A0A9W5TBX6_BABOV|nr:TB2 HVA22 domain-containing protein [Babesia ovis]